MSSSETEPAPADSDEIIVTGERAKRSLKDTPSSVAVFDKRKIEDMAAPDRIQNLLAFVPNVLMPTSRDAPFIRGQSSVGVLSGLPGFLGGARPRTVMQIDGRTVTFNEFVNSNSGIWDVDRVEVFRSPQTTTQGVNSIAGAIFINTADPTYEPEGHAQLVGGQSSRRQGSAAISGPLIDDQLALRVSGDIYGARSSVTMKGPTVGITDLNIDRYWTVRAKMLAEPRAIPNLRLLTTYVHTHSQAPQVEFARAPFEERRNDSYPFGYFKSDVDSVTTLLSYRFEDALESRTTLSWGKSRFRRFAPVGFGQTDVHGRDASAETVLEWKPEGPIRAVGGVSFQKTDLDQVINLSQADLGIGTFGDRQRSAGIFGEITWQAAPRLSLIAGARYQADGKERRGVLTMAAPPELPLDYDKTTRAFLPKLSLAYDITDDVRVGALVQRAYNPGGVTLDPAHREQLEFKPEYLWDFEAFTRASFLDGRLSVTGNLFYNSIKNAQRELDFDLSSPGGTVYLLQIINEPKARTYGAELEATAKPIPNLTLTLGLGLLDTKIVEGVATGDPFLDKQFAGAPPFTGSAGVEWKPVQNVRLSGQIRRQAGYAGDDADNPITRTKGFWMADARASWDIGHFSLFAYAQNIFDTFEIIGWAGPRDLPSVQVQLTEPRELGVGLQARF